MANDPVYITFEFRGNLEDEVEKVTLGIKGLRDESAKTYQRLIADSGAAYGAMSAREPETGRHRTGEHQRPA